MRLSLCCASRYNRSPLQPRPHRPRPLHHPSRCALRMVPLPRYGGGGCKHSRSRDAIRTRVIVTRREILRSPPRSSPENAGGGGRYLTICASSHDVRRKKKRKRNAERRRSVSAVPFGMARALQSALAFRRSTTALCHWDYSSQGSTWARLRDTHGSRGGFSASRYGTSSDAPRAPVIVPAG